MIAQLFIQSYMEKIMKILSILILIPSITFAKFTLKDKMIQPFQLHNQNMQEFISDYDF